MRINALKSALNQVIKQKKNRRKICDGSFFVINYDSKKNNLFYFSTIAESKISDTIGSVFAITFASPLRSEERRVGKEC